MKYIVAVFLILISSVVLADTQLWVSFGNQNNSNNTTSNLTNVKVFHNINKTLTLDAMINNGRNTITNSNTTQYEIGLAKKFPVNNFIIPYVKGAVGVLQPSTSASKTYTGAEIGTVARFGSTGFYTKFDTGFYTGLNNDVLDTQLTKAGIGYMLSPKDTIMIRHDRMRGDMNFDVLWLQYGHRF